LGSGLSVVVLTFNSELTIGATLESARLVSDDLHVVDSGSTDATLEIARACGARIVQHPFESYAAQRNWAIDTLPLAGDWELHLDADERLSPALAAATAAVMRAPPAAIEGYFIPRLTHFHGRPIRHGGMYPIWHMRLFRRGKGRCENRRYDQHFFVTGPTARLAHPMIDDVRMDYAEYLARHARWAAAEAEEVLSPGREGIIAGAARGNPVEQKRYLRGLYYRAPPFLRAFALFFYRYVLRGGFLDGREGLIFFVLQTLVFRILVDAALTERRRAQRG
jgi:glycosyltransferase involved in cell wall biosynthesis